MSPTRDTMWLHGKQVTITVNTSVNASIDAPKTNLRQYMRSGGGFVGIHNAWDTVTWITVRRSQGLPIGSVIPNPESKPKPPVNSAKGKRRR